MRPTSRSFAPHVVCGPTGPGFVIDPGEQQEQGVAAELQETASGVVRDLQERNEALPDGGGELLGSDLPVLGESF